MPQRLMLASAGAWENPGFRRQAEQEFEYLSSAWNTIFCAPSGSRSLVVPQTRPGRLNQQQVIGPAFVQPKDDIVLLSRREVVSERRAKIRVICKILSRIE